MEIPEASGVVSSSNYAHFFFYRDNTSAQGKKKIIDKYFVAC